MDQPRPDSETASPRQIRAALAAGAVLLALALGLAPLAGAPLALPADFDMLRTAALLTASGLLAFLAWQRGLVTQRAASLYVAAALLLTALTALSRAFMAPVAQAWLDALWHVGFSALLAAAAWAATREPEPQALRSGLLLSGVLAAAFLMALGAPLLAHALDRWQLAGLPGLLLALAALAGLIVPPLRRSGLAQAKAKLLWLGVALLAAAVEAWLGLFQGPDARTVGGALRPACSLAALLALAMPLLRDLGALHRRVLKADAIIESLAARDGLTGLANRRHFEKVLADEWARSFRNAQPLVLLRIDVDLQQLYNERYGPAEGDELLRRLGALLAATCNRRAGDLSARIGGDEFAVILPDTDIAGAAVMAALVRRELAELALPHADSPVGRVTVSIGIAPTHPRQTGPQDLLRAADDALFRAKADGRDQASLAPRMDNEPLSAQWAAAQSEIDGEIDAQGGHHGV